MTVIAFVATAWGPHFGGLNVFNEGLARAVARHASRDVTVACLVPPSDSASSELDDMERLRRERVTLRPLTVLARLRDGTLGEQDRDRLLSEVTDLGPVDWWVGHDIQTGPLCAELARQMGRSVIVLHTVYPAYAPFKGTEGEKVHDREHATRQLLNAANAVIGVGPKIKSWAADNVRSSSVPVTQLVPGLAEIEGLTAPPTSFSAITYGRLGDADAGVKLGGLAAAAFGRLVREDSDCVGQDPRLYVVGIQRGDAERLASTVEGEARRRLSVIPVPFTERQDRLFGSLREASVALMLSVHEGFGLAGWEAISAKVPLVVSRNSGLYQLLEEAEQPSSGYVWPVDVRGQTAQPWYQERDVRAVVRQLRAVVRDICVAKRRADALHGLLARQYTWDHAAQQFLGMLGLPAQPWLRMSWAPRQRQGDPQNKPPPVVPTPLRDRRPPQREILLRRLTRRDKLVTALVGCEGTGKTALVSEVFAELQRRSRFQDMDYLSGTGPLAVSGHRLLRSLSAMARRLGNEAFPEMMDRGDEDWFERLDQVLHAVVGDVLVVIDQVERLLDADGRFRDPALGLVVRKLSKLPNHRVSLLLVSNVPLGAVMAVPDPHDVLTLDDPLPLDQAGRLLRDLWASRPPGNLQRNADQAVRLVGGSPRVIELLVAVFATNDNLTVGDLADLGGLPVQPCVDKLVERILAALTPEEVAVVRALSVLGVPSTPADIAATLEDIVPAADVRASLPELAQNRVIRRDDGNFDMSPAQIRAVQRQWSGDSEADGRGLRWLRRRAAERFQAVAERATPRRLEDLAPHLRHIELRLELGERAAAMEIMDKLDQACLRGWGHRHALAPWRRLMMDFDVGNHYWRANLSGLAAGEIELDQLAQAEGHLKQALAASQDPGEASAASDRLTVTGQLGLVYWFDGRPLDAFAQYSEQLQVAVRRGQSYEQARARLGMACCHIDCGRLGEASDCLDEAEVPADPPPGTKARQRLSSQILLTKARVARLRAEYSLSRRLADDAVAAANTSEDHLTRVRALAHQASVLLDTGFGDDAIRDAEIASSEVARHGVADVTRTAHVTLAIACLHEGKVEDGLAAAQAAAGRFFPSKRGLMADLVIGMAQWRTAEGDPGDASHGHEAANAFAEVIRAVEEFEATEQRPYWVWEMLAVAEAGQFLLEVPGARKRAVNAFRRTRQLAPFSEAPGAVHQAKVMLTALTKSATGPGIESIQAAATGSGR